MPYQLITSDSLTALKQLPSESIQCCITSPPYYMQRDYHVAGQIGLEEKLDDYLDKIINVMMEVHRVLRKDGTLWLNLGDTYATGSPNNPTTTKQQSNKGSLRDNIARRPYLNNPQLKAKDLCGVPWRVAFALQERGWYLRSDIIYARKNGIPESVKDRPTRSHEYVFLLSKSKKYFYDCDAIREPYTTTHPRRRSTNFKKGSEVGNHGIGNEILYPNPSGKNKRDVWILPVSPLKNSLHFASFNWKLVEPCVKAGTSSYGCCDKCKSPYIRIVEREQFESERGGEPYRKERGVGTTADRRILNENAEIKMLGWKQNCKCENSSAVPCVILDPFSGIATVGVEALKYNQNYIGIDLNPDYNNYAKDRLDKVLNEI